MLHILYDCKIFLRYNLIAIFITFSNLIMTTALWKLLNKQININMDMLVI